MNNPHDIWDALESVTAPGSLSEEMFYLVSAYADGECTPKERRLVEAYLAENAHARELLSEIRAQAAVIAAEAPEPPAWLHDAILSATTRRLRLLGRIGLPRVAALAGCAAALALAIAYWPGAEPAATAPLVDVIAVNDAADSPSAISPGTTGPVVIENVGTPAVVSDMPQATRITVAATRSQSGSAPALAAGAGGASLGQPEAPPTGTGAGSATATGGGSQPSVRMGPEPGPVARVVPQQPDVVAMAGQSSEGEERAIESRTTDSKSPAGAAKDPREGLRKRLEAVNQTTDVQDAFKGGK